MAVILGEGDHRYRVEAGWGRLPDGWSLHGICVDSRGDIYVGEVSFASWPSLFPDQPRPDNLRSLQKLVKL